MKAVVQRRIHGLVLRINSPGGLLVILTSLILGDAVASDTIWNAASFAKGTMPVIASLGDVAASGGYYVASAANHIYTNPATITGSIGVIAGWPVIKRLLDQVEVNSDSIQSMPNAAWNHMMIGLPETEEAKLKTHIDHMYNTFKKVVATGRNMSMDDVERVAQGQVYTGCQAVKLGLADGLGGTTEAIMLAGVFSLHRDAVVSGNEDAYAYWAGKVKNKDLFESALKGGQEAVEVIRDLINLSPELSHLTAPDDTQIRDLLLKRANISLVPAIAGEVIPRVNPANETFGAMIEHAFQSDDERSPIPVDELSSPSDGTASQLILPALLGIALSNNIPLWQFPMFCYWYASQASGKISTGIFDGWLNRLFAKLAPEANWKPGNTFPKGQKGLDIRMELPPIEIFY
jgi:signal peptide peptidase SppA